MGESPARNWERFSTVSAQEEEANCSKMGRGALASLLKGMSSIFTQWGIMIRLRLGEDHCETLSYCDSFGSNVMGS